MDRAVVMCVAERHMLCWASFGSGRCRQDSSRKRSVQQQRNAFQTQLSFQQCQPFFKNEVSDHAAALARKSGVAAIVVPAVWTMRGPRTYPGGVRKWQWKRRQWKDERELEKQRLMRERKIFQVRRRQELGKTSSPVNSILDKFPTSRESSEEMLSATNRGSSLLTPGSLLGEPALNDSNAEAGFLGKAAEGTQVSETVQGGWTGSRNEVAEQIQKVRDIVRNKNRRLTDLSENQTTSSFRKLPLSPLTVKALTVIKDIRNMTPLQEATFPLIFQGDDLFARTEVAGEDYIASLVSDLFTYSLLFTDRAEHFFPQELPLTGIARIQQNTTVSGRFPITVLLVCPTQEGASFLASEAKLLLMFQPGIRVQIVKGGTDMRRETRCLQSLPCQIVVATPGRLLSHLENSPELRGQLRDLRLFVLMEAQKLLDMGYGRTIERIALMISRSRQTLMWSLTHSDELLTLAEKILKKNRQLINLWAADEEMSRPLVRHDFLTVPMELHLALIFSLLQAHVEKEPSYKVVVFCQTVRTTTFMSETLKNLGFLTCELHARKNAKHRDRAAAVFRTVKDGVILFTCGASVWGVANPDVTLILQVGRPEGREQYLRRVTLTGQETKERECVLLLMPHELPFLSELSTIPLWELALPDLNSDAGAKVENAVRQVDYFIKAKAYVAWLRYHVVRAVSTSDKEEAVKLARIYSTVLEFNIPPLLNSRTIKTLGLKGIIDQHADNPQGD